eukprot:CAMPEP_0198241870 /NCGR_PEP_ID=MMETSP1446-20131203/6960_1 /TAXON_ID=1461542 ORGANISM="Unidentified sp, Strain CCMP2111" /NCGR_SAMPLE_ID=MMETSP1446 /ASSEMBLY_ACC=CAM_ASM_001112 /LENGTH=67 /DNA_ID=CAMNT_0043924777 /DNA_START=178 /DNA_END=377 /DNA_ORIENTATION=+
MLRLALHWISRDPLRPPAEDGKVCPETLRAQERPEPCANLLRVAPHASALTAARVVLALAPRPRPVT